MSTHKVEVCRIDEVQKHPNADRLDLVRVKGWHCVTGRGTFKPGDQCIYIPIDSVLPQPVEEKLFPPGSKVTLSKHRVKTIKLRGAVSQGMVIKPEELWSFQRSSWKDGADVTKDLGITKYEPPVRLSTQSGKKGVKLTANNPHFRKYTDLENIKNFPTVFEEGEPVIVTEKIHGTNFRAGWVPYVARSWWAKLKGWFGLNPQWEFVYGSRNLQLQLRKNKGRTYYAENVYWEAVEKYKLKDLLCEGEVVYGEVYGPDIQKGYHYGLKSGERKLVLFDVYHSYESRSGYVSPKLARDLLSKRGLPVVPLLYDGPYNAALVSNLSGGPSVLDSTQSVREGCVVRSETEQASYYGRKVLKVINDDYLLSKEADEEVSHDQVA